MTIIHLSNTTNSKVGGGIYEVVSNIVKSMKYSNNISNCYFVRWYNFPFKLLLKKNSDLIIHRHGLWTIDSVFLLLLNRFFNIPFILHPHGLYSPIRNEKSKIKKMFFFKLIEKHLFRKSKFIIACSESEKQMLVTEKIEFSKTVVLRNGIDELFFKKRNYEMKIKNSICYFGQIIPIKNIQDPIKVIHMLKPNLMFKIAGYGNVQYENDLKNLVDKLSLNNQISFLGPIYGEKRIDLYNECDIFILPSYNENFGIVVLEALSRGCKVITTTGTPWKDIHLKNLFIYEPNDLIELKKIIEMLINFKDVEDNSEELNKYRWSSIVNELIEIYKTN